MRVKIEDLTPPIYLTPFTALSALMYHALKNYGIPVAGFCDNNKALHGEFYDDCKILPPPEMIGAGEEPTVIICAYYTQIRPQMRRLGINRLITLEQVLTKNHVAAALSMLDKKRVSDLAPKQMIRLAHIDHEIRKFILPDAALTDDSFILPYVEMPVTEKCTLKCAYCSNLMQYFKSPRHIEFEQLCADFDCLMKNVDFVRLLKIIGGEPFLHPKLPSLISYFSKNRDKYGSFQLTTNGTVIPDDKTMRVMKDADIYVLISDYGELSANCSKLVRKLDEFGIAYQLLDNLTWRDVMRIVDESDTREARTVFDECTMTCFTVKNGRFYYCPFLAQGETLMAFPYDIKNHVVLDASCLKDDIRSYFESNEAPPGCKYCSGFSEANMVIPVARQVGKPLEFARKG